MKHEKLRVIQIHPFCAHYTVGLFEELSSRINVKLYFYSNGEWFWPKEHGTRSGKFNSESLWGFRIGRGRVIPSLIWKLLRQPADAIISSIDGRFTMPLAYAASRLKGTPFLLWTGIWSRIETPLHRFLFPLTRYFYRHADAVIVYGEHVKRYLVSEGVKAERVFVAPHSVDNSFYGRRVTSDEQCELRQNLGISSRQKVVLFLGRLEEVKGVEYLIRAFAAAPSDDAVLVIAGEGSQRAELEAMVRDKELADRVLFAGYVPIDRAVTFQSIAHVCVLPSISTPVVKELWGLVVNEAFNQGVPVVATDAVGAAAGGLLQDGVNGFVIPERNADRLSHAIAEILDDKELRGRLGANARAAISNWTHKRMTDVFVESVEYAIREKQTRAPSRAQSQLARDESRRVTCCPLCRSANLAREVGAFRKCVDCGLLFRDPMPALRDLDALYNSSWLSPHEHSNETGGTTPELAEAYAEQIIRSLHRRNLNGLKILEYGAGRGELLTALSKRGADVYALEPYGRDYLQQRGFQAFERIEDLAAGLTFDGIVTVDVVEHEFAAWEILRRFQHLLTDKGWLFISTPNPEGLNARLFGGQWREAKKPGHLLFFPPKTLERVLQTAGFVRARRLRWNIPYGNSLFTRVKDFVLSRLSLDGELRYLAFHEDGESR
jgi:glycosyltransferase involved in cell wall biosynthesis